jgi:hypothetical protein
LPAIYDVYGFGADDLGGEPDGLAEVLGVVWEPHDSDYLGPHLVASGQPLGGGRLVLQSNDLHDSDGGYLQLPDFPLARFLLFVNKVPDADGVRARLTARPQWKFLQRRVLD